MRKSSKSKRDVCQCGKVARKKGLCFACNTKQWREKHPEKAREQIKKAWTIQKEKGALGNALRAFFRRLDRHRFRGDISDSHPQRARLKVEYTCAKCHKQKKGFRTHIDGAPYCRTCVVQMRDREVADEIYRVFRAQKHIDEIDPLGEMRLTCTKLGTCDILHFHHELLKDDPERMRTDFLVSMICGDEKAEKYKNKTKEKTTAGV